jgi:hypothetical protein
MLQTQNNLDVCELRCLEFRPFVSTLIMILFRPLVCHCNELGWDHVSVRGAPCHCPATLISVKVCSSSTEVHCCRAAGNETLLQLFNAFFCLQRCWYLIESKLYFYKTWCRLTYVQLVLLKLLTSKRFTLQMNTDVHDGAVGASLIT